MIRVEVPATSANCCVGFDSLGMALTLKASFTFEPSAVYEIYGCPEPYANENNLVLTAFRHACRFRHKAMPVLKLTIDSPVPFARGLGSSSCCIAAGIAAANAWYDLHLTQEEMLQLATELEGHPDNAAPALFGSMNACFMQNNQIYRVRFDCADFHCLAVIPPYEVSTPEARKVLPASLSFQDAAAQTGHALVFEKALELGDESLLAAACIDYLHEPYRKALIPDYTYVKAIADEYGKPFWISGSGPTMLILSMDRQSLEDISQTIQNHASHLETQLLEISKEGTVVRYE